MHAALGFQETERVVYVRKSIDGRVETVIAPWCSVMSSGRGVRERSIPQTWHGSARLRARRRAPGTTVGATGFVLRLLAGSLALGAAGGASGEQPSVMGSWEWTRKSNACPEQYVFRDDGVVAVTSGERHTESTFVVAWAPEPNGRYRMTMTTVRNTGGRDCSNSPAAAAGTQRVVYALFGQSRETMILCTTAAGADCIGPLRRTAP